MFNFSSDGTTTLTQWARGQGVLLATGDFGSGTLSVYLQDPKSKTNFLAGSSDNPAQVTAEGCFNVTIPAGYIPVLTLTGSTAPDLNVDLAASYLA